jgi:hypothetical protein
MDIDRERVIKKWQDAMSEMKLPDFEIESLEAKDLFILPHAIRVIVSTMISPDLKPIDESELIEDEK